nr:hypothetical protein [Marinicella sp. W31]MDC2879373.1 hypothetical protein [Marinicella sp. W31]
MITESGTLIMEMMRAGLGIGLLLKEDVALFPDLEEVFPAFKPISVPIWLVTHRELHSSRRIRVVYDILAEFLAKLSVQQAVKIGISSILETIFQIRAELTFTLASLHWRQTKYPKRRFPWLASKNSALLSTRPCMIF